MLELAGVVILGILAQWIAWSVRLPAILPLIIIGLLVGPIAEMFFGHKLIHPVYQPDTGHGLFAGHGLFHFVELAIGVILFEGGLTLRRRELQGVGPSIIRLITVGSIVTFFGAGVSVHYILGLSWSLSFLFGGLIIVTGPTVIAPILRNVPLNRNVSTILKWEGILIDPIGALVAVLVYEFIIAGLEGHAGNYSREVFIDFAKVVAVGSIVGIGMAYAVFQLIKRELIPRYLMNVFTLSAVLLAFVLSDTLAPESGLLTVVLMGMTLGNLDTPHLEEILSFKESITILLISILFILLSANINADQILLLNDWSMLLVFAIVVLILRPAGVFLSTFTSALNIREKLFVSWVGPRGIVAAGIASLFGLRLADEGIQYGDMITPLVFMIVLGTVLLNATTARPLAKLLKVTQSASNGILILGANPGARLIAGYLVKNNRHVVLADRSESSVKKAREKGLEVIEGDIFSEDFRDRFDLLDIGYLMAMTSNEQINKEVCKKYHATLGENGTFRLISSEEMKDESFQPGETVLFSKQDDYLNVNEVARDFPEIHEVPVNSAEQFHELINAVNFSDKSIPVFIKLKSEEIQIFCAKHDQYDLEQIDQLVYIGKKVGVEKVA